MRARVVPTLIVAALLVLAAWAPSAQAAFPGQNGKIAWDNRSTGTIWTMNPDGTAQTPLRAGRFPAWSADGTALLFVRDDDVRRMPADGSGETALLNASGTVGSSYLSWETPAWSPDGMRIVASFINGEWHDEFYLELYTASAADGSNKQLIAAGEEPTWRPDGSLIAFSAHTQNGNSGPLHAVLPNGTFEQVLIADLEAPSNPDYSPDGTKIVYTGIAADRTREIFVVPASGSPAVRLTNNSSQDIDPVWSPDGTKIAFATNRDGNYEIYTMNPDGSNQTRLTMNSGEEFSPSWQPSFGSGYARPKGATPMYASLVPAYNPCASPNRTHGPPLAFGSCNSPAQSSGQLTVGSPDAVGNGQAANAVGFAKYDVIAGVAGGADDADVKFTFSFTDVRLQGTLADYTGQLQATTTAQITDRLSGPATDEPATGSVELPITVPCAATGSTSVGSTCSIMTSFDAIDPGAVTEIKRSIWQLDRIRVNDGGADGLASTTPNTLFAVQGIFVP